MFCCLLQDEAMDLLVSGADQLLAKAEELEQEEKQQQGGGQGRAKSGRCTCCAPTLPLAVRFPRREPGGPSGLGPVLGPAVLGK